MTTVTPRRENSFLATRRGKLTLALLCAVAFLDFVDGPIVNVALPSIRHALHFSVANLQWVPSGYLLTYGGFMLLGGRMADLLGRSAYDIIHVEDRDEVRHLSKLITDAGPTTFSYRVMRKNGSVIWFETTSRSVRNPATGRLDEIICVSRDISERKRAEEQIEYQAYHDALTGLPNRRLFRDRLTVALAHARRATLEPDVWWNWPMCTVLRC